MAVEARHLNLFCNNNNNSEMMMNPVQGHVYGYGGEAFLPAYNTNSMMNELMLPKTTTPFISSPPPAMQSESGLTYNNAPRKRPRVESNPNNLYSYNSVSVSQPNNSFSFLGEDISLQIQQHQSDIDRLISNHMEKVRVEIQEKRKREARRIVEIVEMGMMKRLRVKEAEVEKIGKLNWALEEKVRSLCVENQIWRDLAHTNEATANALRTNLEQVLKNDAVVELTTDDAESCCGSSEEEVEGDVAVGRREERGRWCRNCGKEESCVLLLPCRHLCLCTVCGSTLHTCPVCKSINDASVHVNLS